MKKKILTAAVCAALLTLTACGKSGGDSKVVVPQTSTSANSSAKSSSNSSPAVSTEQGAPQSSNAAEPEVPVSEPPVPEPSGNTDEDAFYTYKSKDGGIEIMGGENESEEITIPEEINGRRVVSICGNAKSSIFPNVKKITLPDTLTEINDYAFAGCADLHDIIIPSSVDEIGEYAFRNCISLEKIAIPASVGDIDDHAFDGCSALTEITIADGVRELGEGAFSGCTALTKIDLPDSVTEIDTGAFDSGVEFTVTYKGSLYTPANINDLYNLLR